MPVSQISQALLSLFKFSRLFPQATVRMVINYKKTQKTILRVNPRVPLSEHLPAICEKCEFNIESTVLLKDVHSLAPLDLSCSLNDYAIREVYARDPSSTYQMSQNILKRWVQALGFASFCTKSYYRWFYRTTFFSCESSLTNPCRYLD